MEAESSIEEFVSSRPRRIARPAVDSAELMAVFAGGFIGVLARAVLAQSFPARSGAWPWATFAVNVVGAALAGFLITSLQERLAPSSFRRALLGTGLCGALTTFATVVVQLVQMLEAGHPLLALGYGAASVAGGLCAVFFATKLVRRAHVRA